jgi:hypothetical protein
VSIFGTDLSIPIVGMEFQLKRLFFGLLFQNEKRQSLFVKKTAILELTRAF